MLVAGRLQHQDAVAVRLQRGLQARLALGQDALESRPVADVGHRAHQRRAPLELGAGPGEPHLETPRPAGREEAADLPRRLDARAGLAQHLQNAEKVVGVDQSRQGRVPQRLTLCPDHPRQGGVGVHDPIVLENEDPVAHTLDQAAVALLRIAQAGVQIEV